jgi:hypothetical protein
MTVGFLIAYGRREGMKRDCQNSDTCCFADSSPIGLYSASAHISRLSLKTKAKMTAAKLTSVCRPKAT